MGRAGAMRRTAPCKAADKWSRRGIWLATETGPQAVSARPGQLADETANSRHACDLHPRPYLWPVTRRLFHRIWRCIRGSRHSDVLRVENPSWLASERSVVNPILAYCDTSDVLGCPSDAPLGRRHSRSFAGAHTRWLADNHDIVPRFHNVGRGYSRPHISLSPDLW